MCNAGSAVVMAVELIIAPEVEPDLAEAYAWYEARRTGLGEEFLSCVDAGIAATCRMPEMYAAVHEQYRRRFVRRFPYAIFYELELLRWAQIKDGDRCWVHLSHSCICCLSFLP